MIKAAGSRRPTDIQTIIQVICFEPYEEGEVCVHFESNYKFELPPIRQELVANNGEMVNFQRLIYG